MANGYEAQQIQVIVDAISNQLFPNKYRVEMGTDHLKVPLQDILLASSSSSSSSQSQNHDVFVRNLSGFIAKGHEAKLVKEIVDAISYELFSNKDQVEMGTSHLKIPLQDILLATNKFAEANIIATTGFGKVYKGKSARHGIVAIKQLDRVRGQGDREFTMEIALLSICKHENIASLAKISMKFRLFIPIFSVTIPITLRAFHLFPSIPALSGDPTPFCPPPVTFGRRFHSSPLRPPLFRHGS
ncbi:hypothetical protein L6452_13157 [Arctium lappa]|uniref:Uncharacterized protein n=1 Tax=Arctium lappa TaxID=4217 RepID=A0ACB9CHG4_ARCLA|nr:hypothetical protein L6452_13157 [Arctium lappa]